MISKIKLCNIATYSVSEEFVPKKINYIFGGNGTGKTSISKLLHNVSTGESSSNVEWDTESKEKIVVFNRYFIKDNFELENGLNGIFTLGEETIQFQQKIRELEDKIANNERQLKSYRGSSENLADSIITLKTEIVEKCWSMKQKYGTTFPKAFEGFANSKSKFSNKLLSVLNSGHADNTDFPLDDLRQEYDTAFSLSQDIIQPLEKFDAGMISALSDDSLINESIIGSSHSQVGELISRLNSDDWVKAGIHFAHQAEGVCPYCQQSLSDSVQKDIEDYFDESYKAKCALLEKHKKQYESFLTYLRNYRDRVPENSAGIAYTGLQDCLDSLLTQVERNIMTIDQKIANPSHQLSLVAIQEYVSDIQNAISQINNSIDAKNRIFLDRDSKENCREKIWGMCANEVGSELKLRLKKIDGLQKGVNNTQTIIINLEGQITEWQSEISEIETKISNVRHTVIAINSLLKSFGFEGFMLEENTKKPGSYKIVRPDGTEAQDTLSEGEYNFISFLYFYHLCFGSMQKNDISNKKIIVIDDPISSLDSNVMFIVSSLTKDILRKCKDGMDNITQVFVLTHNAYFHKEVTYWGSREALSEKVVSYFVIRKKQNISSITQYDSNPIRSTYESMWDDIKHPKSSATTICNTMRRILEHYFNVIGGLNYDECIDKFSGQDRIICKSLISFVNDGSHSIFDDYNMVVTDESIDAYLKVFQNIFEKMGHEEHYSMMMKKR